MKNCFSVYYNNTEIVLSKSDVKFRDGYGIIKPIYYFFTVNDSIYMPLIGIVDYNYQLVDNLYSQEDVSSLDLFSEGNFLYKISFNDSDMVDGVFQGRIKDGSFKGYYDLGAIDYKVINDTTVKLTSLVEGFKMYSLYNVSEMRVSDYYNYIGDFKYSDNYYKEVADAAYLVIDQEGNVIDIISVVIDIDGNRLSSFKDLKFNLESNDLEELKVLINDSFNVLRR